MRRVILGVMLAAATAAGLVQACADDEIPLGPKPDAGISPPEPPPNPPATDGGTDGGTTYTVPAGGGSVDFKGRGGTITFVFPASAAGKMVTLASADPDKLGFLGAFSDAITLGPDATHFTDPVIVKPSNKAIVGLMLSFAGSPTAKSPASPLYPTAAGDGFELRHFSTLVIVPPDKVCDSQSQTDTPAEPTCADAGGGATALRAVGCKGFNFCLTIAASCCVDPSIDGGTGCSLSSRLLKVDYQLSDSNAGQYPYCDLDGGDWDGGDAGCAAKPAVGFTGDGGCTVSRTCAGTGATYQLDCDSSTCGCTGGSGTPTFQQATTCDTGSNIEAAFAQKCNYPTR
jgi:hypothetical protein